jgi:four helix bundle protein
MCVIHHGYSGSRGSDTEGADVKSHKDLDVWKAAIALSKDTYLLTAKFPKEEVFGLSAQMRKCAVSIASNIAEGAARQSDKEFIQFLYIALGSAAELETQLLIAKEVGIASAADSERIDRDLARIRKMLYGLIQFVKDS